MGQRRSKRRAVRFQGIPGGVARGSIPGRVATSYSIPVGSKQRWCDSKSFVYTRVAWWTAYTRSDLDFVYTRSLPDSVYTRSLPDSAYTRSLPGGVLLFTPVSVGWRALGQPIQACWAIATAFARRPLRSASPGWWRSLGKAGISNIHNGRRLGLAS